MDSIETWQYSNTLCISGEDPNAKPRNLECLKSSNWIWLHLLKAKSTIHKAVFATVTITISDVNDNSPAFINTPYRGSVLENSPTGLTVLRVFAQDADLVSNLKIYNILNQQILMTADILVTRVTMLYLRIPLLELRLNSVWRTPARLWSAVLLIERLKTRTALRWVFLSLLENAS